MAYIGDIRLGATIDTKFTTRQISGAPFTLAGSPVISAYVGNGTTEITAGITLSVDFDSRTGLNNVRVVATSGNGFATATDVQLVITTGTVNSVSVVGEVIAEFSIENRSAVMPTVAARTLDVSATGEAGVDWANVGSPSTSVNLSATTTNLVNTATTVTNQLTAAAIATGVWQDATAGDFTAASSIGKALYIANIVPGASGGHFISGSNAGTTTFGALTVTAATTLTGAVSLGSTLGVTGTTTLAAVNTGAVAITGALSTSGTTTLNALTVTNATTLTGAVAATNACYDIRGELLSGTQTFNVTGNITGNLSGSVGSVTSRVTANTDQLAGQTVTAAAGVTFPTSVASPTNITAGTITTVTNLTNAATAGDFTATMKTSIGTAVAASAVASVTGNVGGNVAGSVGSVVGAVGSVAGNVGGDVSGNVSGSVGSVSGNVGGKVNDVTNIVTGAITVSGGIASADIKKVNAVTVTGDGEPGTEWGP